MVGEGEVRLVLSAGFPTPLTSYDLGHSDLGELEAMSPIGQNRIRSRW